jgi:D-serine deaminase-like pyridoxal phosphate-dependent protein
MPDNCHGLVATYNTAKTETEEVVLMGPHGILSFKVVVSSNGRKTSVYSGYDPATWSWDNTLKTGTMKQALWEHAYIDAQERSAKKNGGEVASIGPNHPELVINECDRVLAILDAIQSDEKVRDHWRMFMGEIAGVSSMRGASRAPMIAPAAVAQRQAVDERKQLQMADEDWGRF